MSTFEQVQKIIGESLALGDRAERLTPESRLFGDIPEFDSMAVLTVVTSLEDHFDIVFDDEDISEENFADVACLVALVESKRQAA
ncbi:acyl carrier protein [Rhodothalassium salexigens DSM 2132]|uniref:Acyl carrier protein n=1 Tax=Rhodothalassium salexigens DSM 2132 TaxID=1188247 RepID=A0A4R2PEL6_RHOSA|nr:acyl carrier protein [Rhodothalassium salexigens]MBB4212031.1 acyl carrier protein [Rhodothalassium salexigens DSM 2132]MBK1638113.1 acyl carrier protein [Rhodothalassium salexigens DSM 2132]TCP32908.1 acyl carrier protein [Rhodothalassium salexigens DSM 2132]